MIVVLLTIIFFLSIV